MADGRRTDHSTTLLERLAHDLRGPLSPMQTATWLLRKGGLGTERRDELLDIIDRQSGRLSGMVQEISDWVRARDGRLVARREVVPVALLLDLAAGETEEVPAWKWAGDVEARNLTGDLQRLVQMLATLAGFLRAHDGLARRSATTRADTLVLTLEANGPWEDGEQGLVFAGPHPAPHDLGLGMGLLVANEVARAHGGSVEAGESGQGGACLVVALPLLERD